MENQLEQILTVHLIKLMHKDLDSHKNVFYLQISCNVDVDDLFISRHMKKCPHKRSPEKGFLKILGILGFTKISFEGSPNQATAPRQNDQKTKNWRRPDFLNLSATPKWHKTSLDWKVFYVKYLSAINFEQGCYHVVQKRKKATLPQDFPLQKWTRFPSISQGH